MGRARPTLPPAHRRFGVAFTDPRARRRWALVLLAATLTGLLVARVVSRAEQAHDRWGRRTDVLVLRQAVSSGDPLASVVVVESWPVGLVPTDAVTSVVDLADDAVAAGALSPGTPLTTAAVADQPGPTRPRVALPAGPAALPVSAGDTVDVWVTAVAVDPGGSPTTRRVAAGATVVEPEATPTDAGSVVVAVDPEDVAAVAEAAALSTITLVATD